MTETIKVVFFASLRDEIGQDELSLEAASITELLEVLHRTLDADAVSALSAENIRIAVNQSLLDPGTNPALSAGDEVAFLPPVTGG